MMKTTFLNTFAAIILIAFSSLMAQESKLITGTIGKEHMVGKKLVICELGTQACMFLDIDPNLETMINGKTYKPQELQVGWYLQAEVSKDQKADQLISRLDVDPNKTIVCFTELNEHQNKALEKQLREIKGIKRVKTYLKSRQVYIEYDQKTISYPEIENQITGLGYKIE